MAQTALKARDSFLVAFPHNGTNWALEIEARNSAEAHRIARSLHWPNAQRLIVAEIPDEMDSAKEQMRRSAARNWRRLMNWASMKLSAAR